MKINPQKLNNFRALLKKRGFEGFAVTDAQSINFITDFFFSGPRDALLLITQKKAYCFTKPLYIIDLKKSAPQLTLINSLDARDIVKKAKELKLKKCAFDSLQVTFADGDILKKGGFTPKENFLLYSRAVKTPCEIAKIKKACAISAAAYEEFKTWLKSGVSEIEAAKKIEELMAKRGGRDLAFETIAAFGKNTANPHHAPSKNRLKKNQPVLIDYGCRYDGYCSDITRTFWFGDKCPEDFCDALQTVQKSYEAALKAVKPEMKASAADKICRDFFESQKKGLSKYFIHSTGHSLGALIHERPLLSSVSPDVLEENNVFSIEPGLYFENKFGVRWEDTVLLTKNGAEILTKSKKAV